MPSKPNRKLASITVTPPARKRAGAKGASSPRNLALGGTISYLTLSSGWVPFDQGSPLGQVVSLGVVDHVALHAKVKSAASASWGSVAKVNPIAAWPDIGRYGLPCAVRDASADKWYMAMGAISYNGVLSVKWVGRSADGSMTAPFAIETGDEVIMSFVYAQ